MESAIALLLDEGAGRDAAIMRNNLAIARYPLEGPARSLESFDAAIAFCNQRGLAESAAQLHSNRPGLLAELGRTEEALADAAAVMPSMEARGDMYTLIEVRTVELSCRLARGETLDRAVVDWIVETARTIGTVEIATIGLSAAASALVATAPAEATAVLDELEQTPGVRGNPYYARLLCGMVRTALAARDLGLAERLIEGVVPEHPFHEHALASARAGLAEDAGRTADAARLYSAAAAGWSAFGNTAEWAYALLGQGRCLHALGRAEAAEPLREARDLFASMGYAPALAETEALLEPLASRSW
jgi:tetratricopeptide (TPR) repeat protein